MPLPRVYRPHTRCGRLAAKSSAPYLDTRSGIKEEKRHITQPESLPKQTVSYTRHRVGARFEPSATEEKSTHPPSFHLLYHPSIEGSSTHPQPRQSCHRPPSRSLQSSFDLSHVRRRCPSRCIQLVDPLSVGSLPVCRSHTSLTLSYAPVIPKMRTMTLILAVSSYLTLLLSPTCRRNKWLPTSSSSTASHPEERRRKPYDLETSVSHDEEKSILLLSHVNEHPHK